MCVKCDKCHYDSGDFETVHEIAEKVRNDGGQAEPGAQGGWYFECPKGHCGDSIHLD